MGETGAVYNIAGHPINQAAVDQQREYVSDLLGDLAAERALADTLYQAMWEHMKEPTSQAAYDGRASALAAYLKARGGQLDTALARHQAARRES